MALLQTVNLVGRRVATKKGVRVEGEITSVVNTGENSVSVYVVWDDGLDGYYHLSELELL